MDVVQSYSILRSVKIVLKLRGGEDEPKMPHRISILSKGFFVLICLLKF